MANGKGDGNRVVNRVTYRTNYDTIDWGDTNDSVQTERLPERSSRCDGPICRIIRAIAARLRALANRLRQKRSDS